MPDLFPVGSGEFLGEGGNGVLELQDTGVSLGQGAPQTVELFRKTPQLSLRLFQLGLGKRGMNTEDALNRLDRAVNVSGVCVPLSHEVPAGSSSHSPLLFSELLPS